MTGSKGGREDEYTSIRITKEVRQYLLGRGKKGETYSEIVWRMIEAHDKLKVMTDFAKGLPLVPATPKNGKV